MTGHDAVVIGAGPNGLVAANVLADAGWSVLVVEEQPEAGGAVRSDRSVHPDFIHDTFSSFYPLGAVSPALRSLDLEAHGLVWRRAPAVVGHPSPGGDWTLLHREREDTASGLETAHAGDGEAWLELCATWDEVGDPLIAALLSPFPPFVQGARALASLRRAGGTELVRTLLLPAVDLSRRFGGEGPGLLLSGSSGHADIPVTAPGSGLFALVMTMLGQSVGFPVPEGGAGELSAALAVRLEEAGGEIRCGARVSEVVIDRGRASGVRTVDGERHDASRAVLADVSATALYSELLSPEVVPPRVARQLGSFDQDPGTLKVDWALDGPVPWTSPPPVTPGTVHVADSVAEMTESLAQVASGVVPARPFLLVGQMSSSDPTRSPTGTESLWAYTHVPQPGMTVGDAGGQALSGTWSRDECERFADRMQGRLEQLAPGFGSRVVARRVLGPRELETRDRNLVGGALNGGTSQLHQQLVLRPLPALRGRPETGVPGLYLASASAHPGGGVHGAPGNNAARAALQHHRLASLRHLVRRGPGHG